MTERAEPLTKKDVWDAADALLADGENPTQHRVLEALGRGSATTVNKHLKAWREARDETYSETRRRPVVVIEDVPPEVSEHFGKLWEMAFTAARDHVVDALVADREAVAEEWRKAEEAQAQAAQKVEQVESRLEGERIAQMNLQAQYDELAGKLEGAENEVRSLSAKLVAAETREGTAQEKIVELRDTLQSERSSHIAAIKLEQQRYDSLEKRLVKDIENERAGRIEAERRVAAREAEIKTLQARIDRAFALVEESNRVQASLREAGEASARTVNEQREKLEKLERELTEEQAKRDAVAGELALRLNEIEALRTEADQLSTTLRGRIDPVPLLDWIEGGMNTSPRKAFDAPELREVANAIAQAASKLQRERK